MPAFRGWCANWLLQDVVLLRDSCAGINPLCIAPPHLYCPHYRNTIACLLHNMRRSLDPPFCMAYTIQYWSWQYRVKANVQGHRRQSPDIKGDVRSSTLINQSIEGPHKATQSIDRRSSQSHTRAEEKPHPSATSGVANPASRSDTGLGGW